MIAFRLLSGGWWKLLIKRLQNSRTSSSDPFSKVSTNLREPQSQSQSRTPSTEDWLIALSVITEEKIRWADNEFDSYKTAGEDGIFPGLLQQGIEILVVPHYVKYSLLVWFSAMFPKLGKK
jgi:hypothetical protein